MVKMLVNEKYELIQEKNGKTIVHGVGGTPSELIEHYYNHRKQCGYMVVVGQKTRNIYATLGSK
jgi:hypothetical protein